jgi:hypothetical protein
MMKQSVLQKHDPSKREMKSGVANLLEELDFILKLSIRMSDPGPPGWVHNIV